MLEFFTVNLRRPAERKKIETFLARFDLTYEGDMDYCLAVYHNEQLAGTLSLRGRVIRNVAIDPALQGEGLMDKMLSEALSYARTQGLYYFQVFTKIQNIPLFTASGFRLLAAAPPYAALLEIGLGGIDEFCDSVRTRLGEGSNRAALVMNCNPFTRGHLHLVEQAAQKHGQVVVFVVETDRSCFPFSQRLDLVTRGLAHLPQVTVLPSGEYIISNATFPTYFLKGTDALTAQTRLDATLFAERIAPSLSITHRYVGEEPFDPTTRAYNQALQEILPPRGVALHKLPRLETDGQPISATEVRKALLRADWEAITNWVPPVTFQYLRSPAASAVLAQMRQQVPSC